MCYGLQSPFVQSVSHKQKRYDPTVSDMYLSTLETGCGEGYLEDVVSLW